VSTVQLMGILNAAPDSFSDPDARDPGALAEHGRRLAAQGAAVIDVGGESGRTDRAAVSAEDEAERVVEVVGRLAGEGLRVSVDTWRAPVARAALAAGATMVNDPSGLVDPGVASACAEHGSSLVITHTRVAPKQKGYPPYADVVEDAAGFLSERLEVAVELGVDPDATLLDPGLDLGKTPSESVELLRRLPELAALGRPLLVAVSRKDFLGALCGRPPAQRGAPTLAALEAAAAGGAEWVRVHDVAAAADYLQVRAALRGELEVSPRLRLSERLRREAAA
jgi:dihydropteroate synthase